MKQGFGIASYSGVENGGVRHRDGGGSLIADGSKHSRRLKSPIAG